LKKNCESGAAVVEKNDQKWMMVACAEAVKGSVVVSHGEARVKWMSEEKSSFYIYSETLLLNDESEEAVVHITITPRQSLPATWACTPSPLP
jgi:hypothetical protein